MPVAATQSFRKQHFHAPQRKVLENLKEAKTQHRLKWAMHGAIGVVVGALPPHSPKIPIS